MAWTGPPALARFTSIGWNTCPASLALLVLKVLLNATRKVKTLKVKLKSRKEVGHLKSVMLKDLTFFILKSSHL